MAGMIIKTLIGNKSNAASQRKTVNTLILLVIEPIDSVPCWRHNP
jgi:hypothetical protein